MSDIFFKVISKEEAVEAIESGDRKCVQLDYTNGCNDVFELGRLGKKHNCAVSFISQISISIKSAKELERALNKPKDTYQQRLIFLEFDAHDLDINHYQMQASRFGDIIFSAPDIKHIYPTT